MSIFEYLVASLMLVIGLGVTQLLSDAVDAFRQRQRYRLHWLPMTWSTIVFAWQMQFLWAIFELQSIQRSWTATEFTILLLLAMLLFVAGALIVPKASDEAENAFEQFQQDGRWALIVLAIFFVLAYLTNVILFGLSFWNVSNLEDPLLALVLLSSLFAKTQKTWTWITIIFAVLSIYCIVDLSPTAYE